MNRLPQVGDLPLEQAEAEEAFAAILDGTVPDEEIGGFLVALSERGETASEIAGDASDGDPRAIATLERYHDRLARALATVVNILDPDVVVLGGGLSNLPALPQVIQTRLPRYVFSHTVHTRVVRNVHGDSSGVRGAAWLWPAEGLAERA